MKNLAFIDWQNLYQNLRWKIDYKKFRIALQEKYNVSDVFYFLWFQEWENDLYQSLQKAWFILVFNLKWENLKSVKKWNVDSNLIFNVMSKLVDNYNWFNKIILVSGDWDYKVMVDYLIKKWKFKKLLVPNAKCASSLYRKNKEINMIYLATVDNMKSRLEYR